MQGAGGAIRFGQAPKLGSALTLFSYSQIICAFITVLEAHIAAKQTELNTRAGASLPEAMVLFNI